jgi:hypothetical protein
MFRGEFVTDVTNFINDEKEKQKIITCGISHGQSKGSSEYTIVLHKKGNKGNKINNVVITQKFYHPFMDLIETFVYKPYCMNNCVMNIIASLFTTKDHSITDLLKQKLYCTKLNRSIVLDDLITEIDQRYKPYKETEAY